MLTRWLLEKDRDQFAVKISTPDRSFFPYLPKLAFEKINEMNALFHQIENAYKNNVVYFILLHKRDCTFCQQSMPYWKTITEELSRRLERFYSDELEYSQTTHLKNGEWVVGKDVLDRVQSRGVPTILANGKGVRGKFILANKMQVVWDMVIQPFPFLREVFGVK